MPLIPRVFGLIAVAWIVHPLVSQAADQPLGTVVITSVNCDVIAKSTDEPLDFAIKRDRAILMGDPMITMRFPDIEKRAARNRTKANFGNFKDGEKLCVVEGDLEDKNSYKVRVRWSPGVISKVFGELKVGDRISIDYTGNLTGMAVARAPDK